MNFALLIFALIVFGAGVGFAFLRGLPKTRIRSICTLASFLLALVFTFVAKATASLSSSITSAMQGTIEGMDAETLEMLLADGSVAGFVSAVAAPLIFLCLFIAFEIVAAIVCLIVYLATGDRLTRDNCQAPLKGLRGAAWGFLAALLVLVVLLSPISAYAGYAASLTDALPADGENAETIESAKEVVTNLNSAFVVKTHRALFGWLDRSFASFRVNGEKTDAQKELPALASLASDIVKVAGTDDFTSSDNAAPIRRVADGMGESPMLASLVGTAVYQISDEYLEENKTPADSSEAFTYALMTLLHNDAKEPEKLRADLYTMANALVFVGAIDGSDPDGLEKLIKILEANPGTAALVDAFAAVALEELNFGKNANGEYNDTVVAAVDELNEISSLSKEEQRAKVAPCVEDLLKEAGVSATKERVDYFTDVVVEELLPKKGGSLTPESTEEFLKTYFKEHYAELKAKGLI